MKIAAGVPNLYREAASQVESGARSAAADPAKGMTDLMKAEKTAAMGSKLVKAKDEMLGTIIDMKA
ncbi:MAG TPA: flagellar basal body rod C-terminal domain-containing protein [Candidatus Ozemobacteraceae bacterium]|nr:flagellar basal body rod C-terminal domain-containing protein [Candidatus Ozemobacteraceae bacterium]